MEMRGDAVPQLFSSLGSRPKGVAQSPKTNPLGEAKPSPNIGRGAVAGPVPGSLRAYILEKFMQDKQRVRAEGS